MARPETLSPPPSFLYDKFVSTATNDFERALEQTAGMPIDKLRAMSIEDSFKLAEKRLGRPLEFPTISVEELEELVRGFKVV